MNHLTFIIFNWKLFLKSSIYFCHKRIFIKYQSLKDRILYETFERFLIERISSVLLLFLSYSANASKSYIRIYNYLDFILKIYIVKILRVCVKYILKYE